MLVSMKKELALPLSLFGGTVDCERRVARFGSEEEFGFSEPFPISCVGVSAVAARFGAVLSHRDVLGAILGLGVDRSILGDIAVQKDTAFVF
ncbi:MAG: YlmH/Sll1252 family protein [Christensenellales bacterium]